MVEKVNIVMNILRGEVDSLNFSRDEIAVNSCLTGSNALRGEKDRVDRRGRSSLGGPARTFFPAGTFRNIDGACVKGIHRSPRFSLGKK